MFMERPKHNPANADYYASASDSGYSDHEIDKLWAQTEAGRRSAVNSKTPASQDDVESLRRQQVVKEMLKDIDK